MPSKEIKVTAPKSVEDLARSMAAALTAADLNPGCEVSVACFSNNQRKHMFRIWVNQFAEYFDLSITNPYQLELKNGSCILLRLENG